MFTKNFNKVMHQQQNLIKAYHQNKLIWEGIKWIDIRPTTIGQPYQDKTKIFYDLYHLPKIAYQLEFKFNPAYSNLISSVTYVFAGLADDSVGYGDAEDKTRYHLGYSSTKFPQGVKSLEDFGVYVKSIDSNLIEEIKNNLNLQYRIVK